MSKVVQPRRKQLAPEAEEEVYRLSALFMRAHGVGRGMHTALSRTRAMQCLDSRRIATNVPGMRE
ncbi:MAG TPA: hypothetical protein VF161_06850 [Steroidobacteraceae bacterium]|jgi:hypothetical protein